MEVNVYEAKTNFSKLLQSIENNIEEEIIIARNGKPIAKIVPIAKNSSRRIGIAKNEMKGRNITLEQLNSIHVDDFFYGE